MDNNKRFHGGSSLEQQIVRCFKEGWHVANIASIVGAKSGVVEDILRKKKLID